jgi:hypothetical protein
MDRVNIGDLHIGQAVLYFQTLLPDLYAAADRFTPPQSATPVSTDNNPN